MESRGDGGKEPAGLGSEMEGCWPLPRHLRLGRRTNLAPEPSSPTSSFLGAGIWLPLRTAQGGEGCPQGGADVAPLVSDAPLLLAPEPTCVPHNGPTPSHRSRSASTERQLSPSERAEAHDPPGKPLGHVVCSARPHRQQVGQSAAIGSDLNCEGPGRG